MRNDRNVMVNFKPGQYRRKMFFQSVTLQAARKKKIQVLPTGVQPMSFWPRLFKRWIALSSG